MIDPPALALVCVGGGRGIRFGGDKLAERLGRRSVFAAALSALQRAYPAALLVAVCPPEHLGSWQRRLRPAFSRLRLVAGGERRQDSVRQGIAAVLAASKETAEVVAVHDAARPLVAPEDVRRAVQALADHDAVVLCSRVVDTVKRIDRHGRVRETISRDDLRLSQTPQVLRIAALQRAWNETDWQQTWTDEAALLEAVGASVQVVVARHPNPKITNRHDLELVRAMLRTSRLRTGDR